MTRTGISAFALFAAGSLFGCSVLDDLLPRPVRIERHERALAPDAMRLTQVRMERGNVPGAPSATADEAYVLEITSTNVVIVAPGWRGSAPNDTEE